MKPSQRESGRSTGPQASASPFAYGSPVLLTLYLPLTRSPVCGRPMSPFACSPFCGPYLSSFLCKTEVSEHTYLIADVRGTVRPSEACSPYLTMTFSCPILGQESILCSILYPAALVNKLVLQLCRLWSPHFSHCPSGRGCGGVVQVQRKQQ